MNSKERAIAIARALDAKKGLKIKILKIEDLTLVSDYFVVCTGTSSTHCQSLADAVIDKVAELESLTPAHIEGLQEGRWILLDYSDVILHIFQEDERGFYNLEKLWADAPALTDEEVFEK